MASKAAERFAEQKKKEREEIRAKVAKAKASPGKEKFDFQAFARLYDVSQDYGSQPVTAEVMERYEEEYYLGPVQASSIREFAERKAELKLHDSN
jgi:hypothetical protein